MVMRGRNSFEVRDLEDSLSDDTIIPLVLPKLPSAFETSTELQSLNGLIRSNDIDDEFSCDMRKLSIVSSDIESIIDEENDGETKVSRDKNYTEKLIKNDSKNVSPASSRVSWEQAGETMAVRDCSSMSLSSSDESKYNNQINNKTIGNDDDDDDISAVTYTPGNVLCMFFYFLIL